MHTRAQLGGGSPSRAVNRGPTSSQPANTRRASTGRCSTLSRAYSARRCCYRATANTRSRSGATGCPRATR
eukprot:11262132-Prorocentrum_lima.AAC.1